MREIFSAPTLRLRVSAVYVPLEKDGSFFSMKEKMARLEKGDTNPFIDPQGYRNYVERAEKNYRDQLQKEKQAKGNR